MNSEYEFMWFIICIYRFMWTYIMITIHSRDTLQWLDGFWEAILSNIISWHSFCNLIGKTSSFWMEKLLEKSKSVISSSLWIFVLLNVRKSLLGDEYHFYKQNIRESLVSMIFFNIDSSLYYRLHVCNCFSSVFTHTPMCVKYFHEFSGITLGWDLNP